MAFAICDARASLASPLLVSVGADTMGGDVS